LLGLARTATRAEVRSAFLKIAPRFHPDRFFGKKLGVYAEKMQRIFGNLSIAHDTLVDDVKRAAYDRNLPPALPGGGGAPPPSARKGPPPLPGAGPPPLPGSGAAGEAAPVSRHAPGSVGSRPPVARSSAPPARSS